MNSIFILIYLWHTIHVKKLPETQQFITKMVLEMGFEPTRHKPLVPETSVSTIPPLEHDYILTIPGIDVNMRRSTINKWL